MGSKQTPVHLQVTTTMREQTVKNSNILETIVETVLLCGCQNIPLGRHKDDAENSKDPDINTGRRISWVPHRESPQKCNIYVKNNPK